MLHKVTFRPFGIAVCGWLLACNAGALTLGAVRGTVLVGRAVDLSVPVTLDQAGAEVPCPSAEVAYGQKRVEHGVSLRWQPGAGSQGVLQVRSATPVDEPMVTVDLRVGCSQPSTRHYELLAQLPPNGPAPNVPAAVAEPTATPAPAPAPAPTPTPVPVPVPVPVPAAAKAAAKSAAPARLAAPAPAQSARAESPPAVQPHPEIQPVRSPAEGAAILRLTSELGPWPSADPQRRAEAAVLWAALQQTPEELAQETVRLQALQRELQSVRDATQKNAQAAVQMRAEVEQARSQRAGAAWLVGVLTAAFVALLAWLGWRAWRHSRVDQVNRWFDANSESQLEPMSESDSDPDTLVRSYLPSQPDTEPHTIVSRAGDAPGERAHAAPAAAASHATAPHAAAAATRAPAPLDEFSLSRGALRMVGVEEVIDVQDKVDFFVSLGQVDQAIAVLEAHVYDQVETSALPWMDLLELYHREGRRADYDRLRAEFRQHFTARVPDFEHFDQPTASLENYSRALSRIVALWPSRRVLDVIEESIFRKPGAAGAEPFSLEAYRELVLLFHIAKEVAPAEEARDGAARPQFADTTVQPLNMLDHQEPAAADRDSLLVPPSSARVGIDIDLAELGAGEAQQSGPRELPALDFDIPPGASGSQRP
jgi:hypothetical protein